MNAKLLEIGLQIGGWSLVLLCFGSLAIPRALGWKTKLAGLSPLMRELWWTYSLYVFASHVFFAFMALRHPAWLMSGQAAATAFCVFVFLWWAVRVFLQFFGFDLSEVKNTLFNRVAKHILTALFIGLVILFGALIIWNLGVLP